MGKVPRVASMAATQQRVLAEAMMRLDIPVSKVLAVVNHNSCDDFTARECQNEYRQYSRMSTPYGTVATSLRVQLTDGTATDLYINNPFALLYAAATTSPKFGAFLLHHTQQFGNHARIVIYSDETTPGNQHRPGNARSYECLQWTLCELPTWYRERQHGWFKFSYILSDVVDKVDGRMAALIKQMLYLFFSPDDFNFNVTGARIPQASGSPRDFYADFGFFLEDEKAAKVNLAVKGASGIKCCGLECMNVLGVQSHPPAARLARAQLGRTLPDMFDLIYDLHNLPNLHFDIKEHWGENVNIMRKLAAKPIVQRQIATIVEDLLALEWPNNDETARVLLVCNRGRHRSVACAKMLRWALTNTNMTVVRTRIIGLTQWPPSFCSTCTDCLAEDPETKKMIVDKCGKHVGIQ